MAGHVQEQPGQSLIDAAQAAGVLSADEAQRLHQAEAARRVVIDVDDFSKEELCLADGKVR
jgi:acyl-CoA dehydrogenase